MEFSDHLLNWYAKNKRELPWRSSRDPYRIWLSEIILQQTRVAQGLPYYERFVNAFPTVHDLAAASEAEVLKLWQGLGYYSRARNLLATARDVSRERGGEFPGTYKGLLELKGVGPYTAAAIASICFQEAVPVVDGNVFRVLSRYFGEDTPIDSLTGQRKFRALAREVMAPDDIRDYNQAIMEFGAMQCTPRNPDCDSCPLANSCVALGTQRVDSLPVKAGKIAVRKRNFHYLVPVDKDGNTWMELRTTSGIWQGLYQFPLLESPPKTPTNGEELTQKSLVAALSTALGETEFVPDRIVQFNETPQVHKLSHQHLHTTFWIIYLDRLPDGRIPLAKMEEKPVPVLIAKFIEAFKNSYF